MVIKVYVSGLSGNKEVKKRQQRVILILDSKGIKYEVIDIAEPDNEAKKDFMQNNSTSLGGTISDPKPRYPLPPQIFNEDIYCGDYDQLETANELDEMEKFLKLESEKILDNGDVDSKIKENEESKDEANNEKDEVNNENGEENE